MPTQHTEQQVEEFNRKERESARTKHQELKEQAVVISDLRDRLAFWSMAQNKYKQSIWEQELSIHASGALSARYNNSMKLWLDFLIQCELDDLSNQIKHLPPDSSTIDPPEHENQKVICLYELGVLGFLKKRLMTESYSTLSHIIAYFTEMTLANSKKCLERIDGNEYKKDQHIKEKQKIRDRYEIKSLPDINFEKDVE